MIIIIPYHTQSLESLNLCQLERIHFEGLNGNLDNEI